MSVYFISLKDAISWPHVFMILSGICIFLELLFFSYLPETKGRSLEDMSLYFAEVTNDQSMIEAERQLRGDEFMQNYDGGGTRQNLFSSTREVKIARV